MDFQNGNIAGPLNSSSGDYLQQQQQQQQQQRYCRRQRRHPKSDVNFRFQNRTREGIEIGNVPTVMHDASMNGLDLEDASMTMSSPVRSRLPSMAMDERSDEGESISMSRGNSFSRERRLIASSPPPGFAPKALSSTTTHFSRGSTAKTPIQIRRDQALELRRLKRTQMTIQNRGGMDKMVSDVELAEMQEWMRLQNLEAEQHSFLDPESYENENQDPSNLVDQYGYNDLADTTDHDGDDEFSDFSIGDFTSDDIYQDQQQQQQDTDNSNIEMTG